MISKSKLFLLVCLAVGGCIAPEPGAAGDEAASDGVASDELTSDAKLPPPVAVEIRNVTCNSGWPGTRGCHWVFTSATTIISEVTISIDGHNGEVGHTLTQTGPQTIDLTAAVREGDAFNPGANNTKYVVAWLRN